MEIPNSHESPHSRNRKSNRGCKVFAVAFAACFVIYAGKFAIKIVGGWLERESGREPGPQGETISPDAVPIVLPSKEDLQKIDKSKEPLRWAEFALTHAGFDVAESERTEAEKTLNEAVQIYVEHFGHDSIKACEALDRLASFLAEQKQFAREEPLRVRILTTLVNLSASDPKLRVRLNPASSRYRTALKNLGHSKEQIEERIPEVTGTGR